jgi:hypothetical protein
MYLALFLFPWMLMYAISTAAMNHRASFTASGAAPLTYERERMLDYGGFFPDGADVRTISRQILSSLDLEGSHGVARRADGAIVITRNDLLTPRRLTYTPADRTILIERLPRRANALLERFHRRRGYSTGYVVDTAWAISVDLVIAAMLFWVLSGLWMWWEMKVTRLLGASALLGGAGLFAFYLMVL